MIPALIVRKKKKWTAMKKILFIIVMMFSFSVMLLSRGVGEFYVE